MSSWLILYIVQSDHPCSPISYVLAQLLQFSFSTSPSLHLQWFTCFFIFLLSWFHFFSFKQKFCKTKWGPVWIDCQIINILVCKYVRWKFVKKQAICNLTIIIVNFNLLFTEIFQTSFRTLEVHCEVQKFTMKSTSRFVNKVSNWLHVRKQPIKC